ncbi:Uncharacterised protein [Vibrio cholerae]|nr:Uncharacterised protein [Vibrio cholerae]
MPMSCKLRNTNPVRLVANSVNTLIEGKKPPGKMYF